MAEEKYNQAADVKKTRPKYDRDTSGRTGGNKDFPAGHLSGGNVTTREVPGSALNDGAPLHEHGPTVGNGPGNVTTQTTLDGGPIKETLPFDSEAHVAPEKRKSQSPSTPDGVWNAPHNLTVITPETGNVTTPKFSESDIRQLAGHLTQQGFGADFARKEAELALAEPDRYRLDHWVKVFGPVKPTPAGGNVTTPAEEPKAPVRRKMDPELKAMDEVCQILEEFEEPARRRILEWAMRKFDRPAYVNPTPTRPHDPSVPF